MNIIITKDIPQSSALYMLFACEAGGIVGARGISRAEKARGALWYFPLAWLREFFSLCVFTSTQAPYEGVLPADVR